MKCAWKLIGIDDSKEKIINRVNQIIELSTKKILKEYITFGNYINSVTESCEVKINY